MTVREPMSESFNTPGGNPRTDSSGEAYYDQHQPTSCGPLEKSTATAGQKERSARSRSVSLECSTDPHSAVLSSLPPTPGTLVCGELPPGSQLAIDRGITSQITERSGSAPHLDLPLSPPPSTNSPTSSNPVLSQQEETEHPLSDLSRQQPPTSPPLQHPFRRPVQLRKQSLLPASEAALFLGHNTSAPPTANSNAHLEEIPTACHSAPCQSHPPTPATPGQGMFNRKVWVKRCGGTATTVTVREDDMVDDVRDVVLKKYHNALGKSYDAPDISFIIKPRRSTDHTPGYTLVERTLNPDERMIQVLAEYYPNGQLIGDALVIEVPPPVLRKTPRPSPHHGYGSHHEAHPSMEGSDYFSPKPGASGYSQVLPTTSSQLSLREPSISVLTTGQVPPLPGSPGGNNWRGGRPNPRRMQTSSPIIHSSNSSVAAGTGPALMPRQNRSRVNSDASNSGQPPQVPPIQASPIEDNTQKASTPPVRMTSTLAKKFKNKKQHTSRAGLLPEGVVPPINVLIVEDNVINLKLLEAFMKRLKVRWDSAMDGKAAVEKWRAGGFHLVLMDIQLPVMNGLDAAKEIRRLERVNSIGPFSQSPSSPTEEDAPGIPQEGDKLQNLVLFKSPVIIVALTASSLQNDRREALASGCNDFLTKVCYHIFLLLLCILTITRKARKFHLA